MNIELDLNTELSELADDILNDVTVTSEQVKQYCREIARSYGLGYGYICARLATIVKAK